MNTQNTKKPMKIMSLWKSMLVIAALLAVLFPTLGKAGPVGKAGLQCEQQCLSVTHRPLSDFLNAQGTLNTPPQFFPPVRDYVGWADNPQVTFALVDYAGIANKYIKAQTGHALGTKVTGHVKECALAGGKTQVTVVLTTKRALGFAQSVAALEEQGFDFLNTPTNFGAKAQDVVEGADAAVGTAHLVTTFSISAPGVDLPDFLDVVFNPAPYAPVKFSFKSTTIGKCSNGKKAHLSVHQVSSTNDQNVFVPSMEKVEVIDAHGGDCGE